MEEGRHSELSWIRLEMCHKIEQDGNTSVAQKYLDLNVWIELRNLENDEVMDDRVNLHGA